MSSRRFHRGRRSFKPSPTCFLEFQSSRQVYRDSTCHKLQTGTNYVDFGCETSENKNLENFPSFRLRRRSPELEVEDEEYSVSFDGIFSRR